MSTAEADRRFMDLALRLGARAAGRTWPNPAVGCVLVRDGRILGRGWTRPGGRPHAEAEALARAGGRARGATAYVSLEPCAHHGRTPPCTEALAGAGVVRVVTAMRDPDPRVAGRGHAALAAAGIEVTAGIARPAAERAHRGYLLSRRAGRPAVTLKLAASLDGRIATRTGESRWITGEAARRAVHAMRARHDAVLVGGGTARADDPSLTVRGLGIAHAPVRVVATGALDLPGDGRLARTAGETALWLVHGAEVPETARRRWQALGARCLPIDDGGPAAGDSGAAARGSGPGPPPDRGAQGRDGAAPARRALDPAAMLAALGAAGLTRVLCEGGGRLAASLLAAGLVDELAVFSAGVAIGADGTPALGRLGLDALAAAPRFRLAAMRPAGGDALTLWERADSGTPSAPA